jgi:Mg2+ and Co2+ transporter CorA
VAGTAVLVPNTLATMFGVSAIGEHMDEFSILAILLAATVLSAVASYAFIRHKRFVPRHVS